MGVDPGTGLAILGGAAGSAKLVEKLLGPTADYLGNGLRDWTEKRVKNVGRIFQVANARLGDRLEHPGAVPPKVLSQILQDGPFCDDALAAEYFGGVLASSRTEVGRDDRGAAFAALTSRLTSYQLRAHYVFYELIRQVFLGMPLNLTDDAGRNEAQLFVSFRSLVTALDLSERENPTVLVPHTMFGLAKERLIEDQFRFGSVSDVKQQYKEADQDGLLFKPSALGGELYLWAHGRGDLHVNAVLDPAVDLRSEAVAFSTRPHLVKSTRHPDKVFPMPDPDPVDQSKQE